MPSSSSNLDRCTLLASLTDLISSLIVPSNLPSKPRKEVFNSEILLAKASSLLDIVSIVSLNLAPILPSMLVSRLVTFPANALFASVNVLVCSLSSALISSSSALKELSNVLIRSL